MSGFLTFLGGFIVGVMVGILLIAIVSGGGGRDED